MFKGDIFITDDHNLTVTLSYDKRYLVIAMMDNPSTIFGDAPVRAIPYILPPYIASEAENMGDMDSFYSLYYQHLASSEADSYLTLLMVALYKGYNVLIYVNPEEEQLAFVGAFLRFMQDNFGLTIGNKENTQAAFNVAFEDIIYLKMFRYHYISAKDIVANIHNKILDPIICDMLCEELNIPTDNDPVMKIDKYIKHYRTRMQPIPKITSHCPWDIREDVLQ